MTRAVTIAVYVFCINIGFVLIDAANPFHLATGVSPVFSDLGLINTTAAQAQSMANMTSGGGIISGLFASAAPALDTFIGLVVGPLKIVPQLLKIIGFDALTILVISSLIWVVYAILIFQLITSRTLEATS